MTNNIAKNLCHVSNYIANMAVIMKIDFAPGMSINSTHGVFWRHTFDFNAGIKINQYTRL